MFGKLRQHIKMRPVRSITINIELLNYGGRMGENKKRSKTKMMFLTFVGLGVVAVAVKVGLLIKEKMENKRENYYG
jgi:hypothetical protein